MSSDESLENLQIKQTTARRYSMTASQMTERPIYGCSCNGDGPLTNDEIVLKASSLGYTMKEVREVPREIVSLSLGCGNPTKYANLRPGDTVLDVGCGAGLDSVLSSKAVGRYGNVLAGDLSRQMLELCRRNTEKINLTNIEFVQCDGGNLPFKSGSVDHIITNCSINLIPDKRGVLTEANRVLKEAGRVTFSDIASVTNPHEDYKKELNLWAACISGVVGEDVFLHDLEVAGFKSIDVADRKVFHYGEKDKLRIRNFFGDRSDIISSVLQLEDRLETLVVRAEKS